MLSDEEKKAIETIKDFKNLKWYEHAFDNGIEVLDEEEKQDIDILLNLIEKQSKEIEELKDTRSIFNMGRRSYKNEIEDKIKAKIEELEKEFKEYENGQEWEIQDEIRGQIDVLQSLLEKE